MNTKSLLSWFEIPPNDKVESFNLSSLKVDHAYLNIQTDEAVHLYSLSDDCYKCPFVHTNTVQNESIFDISTKYGMSWRMYRSVENFSLSDVESLAEYYLCEVRPKEFGQFGIYRLTVANGTCHLKTLSDPVNIYKPLLIIILGLVILSCLWTLVSSLVNKCKKNDEWSGNDVNIEPKKKKSRIRAIDVFRGFCIAFMIFVNDGGGGYTIFEHATWNGLHLADNLFPWFLWIMGVCIPISVKSQLKKKITRIQIIRGIVQRSVVLFLIGVSLNTVIAGPDLSHIRIFGVLQRLAVTYLLVASLVTFFMVNIKFGKEEFFYHFKDFLNLGILWVLMFCIVASHLYLMFYYPVPGCPAGYTGPGGVQYNGKFSKCTGGFAGYIDQIILFGQKHLYQMNPIGDVYRSERFDPEGPFGCLISLFHGFLGVQAGSTIVNYSDWKEKVKRWLVWGVVCGLMALVLCQGRQEGGWIPINKNIWSLSYVLATSSLAFFILTCTFVLVDVNGFWNGSPFLFLGMNSILCYVGHSVAWGMFPWHWSYGPMNTHFILTVEALWGTFMWIWISYWLFKQKFFLKL